MRMRCACVNAHMPRGVHVLSGTSRDCTFTLLGRCPKHMQLSATDQCLLFAADGMPPMRGRTFHLGQSLGCQKCQGTRDAEGQESTCKSSWNMCVHKPASSLLPPRAPEHQARPPKLRLLSSAVAAHTAAGQPGCAGAERVLEPLAIHAAAAAAAAAAVI